MNTFFATKQQRGNLMKDDRHVTVEQNQDDMEELMKLFSDLSLNCNETKAKMEEENDETMGLSSQTTTTTATTKNEPNQIVLDLSDPAPLAFSQPATQDVMPQSDCLNAAGDEIEAEMMATYLSLHPSLELATGNASVTELAKRFSGLSIDCNAMEVDQDEMDIDLPEIDWMQVDIDEMEIDLPEIDWMQVDTDEMELDGP
ncbi:unnamed protein product [Cylindrotheca closterium]|uniref:Uncharacterized protein n=1 Tax=Cylindrotheca closterium TaxID=2856 RepID=A0AAD2CFR6_9STRA|nr:unnamed protein product [Cylindrotheca closterium]CAJ1933177.1 unnamed protein product [Cylindrotheca closterium]CAJ1933187.1 unnamed protein product [Cylindrotheca closterium]CAJ1935921.1 unnamed protein product [Cylindrotheca closterium]